MANIHPTAIVDPTARIAPDATIGPYTIVGADVVIGAGTVLLSHVVVAARTTLGARNQVFQFSSIGEIAQDRKYGGEPTTTTIGDDNVFREYVTVNAGTMQDRGDTKIGNGNLFLAYTHVAHDCVVGNFTTFSNNAQIAGHVQIDDWAVLGAFSGVHQFCRVGESVMCAGNAKLSLDAPPFSMVAGDRARFVGINAVGMKRRELGAETIAAVKRAYHLLFASKLRLEPALARVREELGDSPEVTRLVRFLEKSERGFCR